MNRNLHPIDQIFDPTDCATADDLLRYANDELDEEQSRQLEKHLIDCPLCSDALEGVIAAGTEGFASMMEEIDAKVAEEVQKTREDGKVIEFRPAARNTQVPPQTGSGGNSGNGLKMISIAAAVALLCVVGYFGFIRNNISPQDIADNYFQIYKNDVRGGEEGSLARFEEAKSFYYEEDYAEAAKIFDEFDSVEARHFAANCYYVLKDYNKAAERFQGVIDGGNSKWFAEADFGLAMTWLMLEKVDAAKAHLEKISADEGHHFSKQAKKALKDIRKL